jgi:hypothetical protein
MTSVAVTAGATDISMLDVEYRPVETHLARIELLSDSRAPVPVAATGPRELRWHDKRGVPALLSTRSARRVACNSARLRMADALHVTQASGTRGLGSRVQTQHLRSVPARRSNDRSGPSPAPGMLPGHGRWRGQAGSGRLRCARSARDSARDWRACATPEPSSPLLLGGRAFRAPMKPAQPSASLRT